MSEPISQHENAGPDTASPGKAASTDQPRAAHKSTVAGAPAGSTPVGSPLLPPVKGTPPDARSSSGHGAGSDPSAGLAHISITQLTIAVLVIIFLWQWLDGHRAIGDMQQQLAKKIAEMDGNSKATQVLLTQDQDQVRELSAKVATMESRYAESQNQRVALEALYNNLSANRDAAALAEVEQMLLNAAQQLQLTANVRAALIAMQSADARLQNMNRPAFNGLRQAIGHDMDKLRALHDVDVTGINMKLNDLIVMVDRMPLAYQQRAKNTVADQAAPPGSEEHLMEPPANRLGGQTTPAKSPVMAGHPDETTWQKLLREIWQEMRQLVRIDDMEKAAIPLLPPNQEFFLRENLKLSLLSARLALLSRDEASFRQGLKTAQLWTARYFDGKSGEGMRMSDGLKKLAASDISIELPDIGASLQAVRNYRLTHEHEPKADFKAAPEEPKISFGVPSKEPKAGNKKQPKAAR